MDRYATRSVAYELLIWLVFWGLYGLWAGYSPSYPKSDHSEPLFGLVVLGFMLVFFFLFGDRNELKLLIANSALAMVLVPGFIALNLYRAITRKFPQSWAEAGFYRSSYVFLIIQCIFLFLSILLFRFTIISWQTADPAVKKRFYLGIAAVGALMLLLSALVMIFVCAG
jgi:hypothetical protein